MLSVPGLAAVLQPLVTTVADEAARASGLVRRSRKLTGAGLVQTLVFGWLARPEATLEELVRMAGTCGVPISVQGLAQRLTAPAAACLRRVLEAAMRQLVAAAPVVLPLLDRFPGVYLWDSTTITLPDALAREWAGCGGRVDYGGRAALKVQVRWEFRSGRLELVALQPGRESDKAAARAAPPLPAGSLRLTDLGYIGLALVRELTAREVLVLCRFPAQVTVLAAGRRWTTADFLATQRTKCVDTWVEAGITDQVPVRLVAKRVPAEVARRRRRQWRKDAQREGHTLSAERLALAAWDVFLTTVPATVLSVTDILAVVHLRWQIELLFKLWKSHGKVDEWRSTQPWRILTEVYAKLVAMLLQHWCLLLGCWADPERSLVKAAAIVRDHARLLAYACSRQRPLHAALRALTAALLHAGRLNRRRKSPTTAQRLLACTAPNG
jgi:hypothetical protein